MSHSVSDDPGALPEPIRKDPRLRAKPHERLTGGFNVEDIFGICADEIDDEFMEALQRIRRDVFIPKEVP